MSTGQCSRCRATYGCLCQGPSTATTNGTFLDPHAELERLRADYRKLWEMTLGPHPVPTVPATVDDPKVFARLVLADELAEGDRALAAVRRVEAWRDELATHRGGWDADVARKLTELLIGPEDGAP